MHIIRNAIDHVSSLGGRLAAAGPEGTMSDLGFQKEPCGHRGRDTPQVDSGKVRRKKGRKADCRGTEPRRNPRSLLMPGFSTWMSQRPPAVK
jgi:hypothetical protein